MGILSRLGFMQQAAFLPQQPEVFSPYFGTQPQQPAPAPQPRPSPAMTGFQSPANLPTAQPIQANQSPLAQLNTAPAPSPQFSFMDRLAMGANQLPNNALFNMGLSLLGNAQGSNWGQVGRDMQAFQQGQQQRQILQNEQRRQAAQDRREETVFGRQQSEWQRADQRRERLGTWAGQQRDNPLAAIDPDMAFQAEAEARAIANQPQTPFQRRQLELQERGLEIEAIRARQGGPRQTLTPLQITNARQNFANAEGLERSFNNFVEMLRNATSAELAGIGPGGAALQSAHRLLSMQAKSPAALDLGALVGADFAILNDILGDPGNLQQLVRQGGREGALARLEPFGTFIQQGQSRLRSTYEPYADQLADFYQERPGLPTSEDVTREQTMAELARAELERRERERRQRESAVQQPGGYRGR